MKIYLAADHRGFELKEKIKEWLKDWGYEYEDMGAFEYNKDDDYPDFVSKAAEAVANDPERSRGIILGGSGQGEAMVANRYEGVRGAVFYGPTLVKAKGSIKKYLLKIFAPDINYIAMYLLTKKLDEVVKLSREHNDSNVLSLGTFFVDEEIAKRAIKLWLETPFSGEERHIRRINKIEE
jgi:ribose 5-phosphate isomerase B